ncbi:hypothetical protein Wcon_00816 [Wolbachia endosymbiont of Cylisticus convexus]|nr:hypothetical protein Wcon_00816 [Wolbachia endosymbiont of Cylisticus convexus]
MKALLKMLGLLYAVYKVRLNYFQNGNVQKSIREVKEKDMRR